MEVWVGCWGCGGSSVLARGPGAFCLTVRLSVRLCLLSSHTEEERGRGRQAPSLQWHRLEAAWVTSHPPADRSLSHMATAACYEAEK